MHFIDLLFWFDRCAHLTLFNILVLQLSKPVTNAWL